MPFGGQKSEIFDRKYSKSFFKIVLPMRARSTFFKKCHAKSELDRKNHERCILKLACLMQIRIHVHPAHVLHLARRVPSEMKIAKISRMVGLMQRAECAGGLGKIFEAIRDLQI